MAQINCIREMFFEKGMNYAEIARETGHDVKTVKKYIYQEDFNPCPQPKERRGSKLDFFQREIDEWLEADQNERKKQRHTAWKVYCRLKQKHGPAFNCSYRLVANYVAEKKKELYSGQGNFYLPLEHIAGEAQVDFGEADFFEGGIRYSGHYLNVSFPFSNAGFMQLFKGQNQQCLMEGLKNIFTHIGGVPVRLWFDNLPLAVKKILKNNERELTEGFLRFKNHYGFIAAFCNANQGHEKGSVEAKVGYHRRNFLVPVPEVGDLKVFNRRLLVEGDQDMLRPHYSKKAPIRELFAEDLQKLLPLPPTEYDASALLAVRTNSYAKFTLHKGRHTYSTAPRYASSELFVKLTAHEVIVLDESYREIKRHPRLYGEKEQESMDWIPYLTQIARRPAALKYTGLYPLFPSVVQDFLDMCDPAGRKQTLRLLARLTEETDFTRATQALKSALEYGTTDPDSILAAFSRLQGDVLQLDPITLPADIPQVPPCQTSNYDALFLKGGATV